MLRYPISALFYIFASISVLYLSYSQQDFSLLFSFFIFSVVLVVLHWFFSLTFYAVFQFSIIILLLPLFINSYITTTELPFYPGGDAYRYFERVILIAEGDDSLLWGRYKFFLYSISNYYKLMIGIFSSKSPFHFMIMTAFFVSLSGPVVFSLIKKISDTATANKVYYLWVLNPLTIGLAVSTLRDPYVYFAVFYFVYVLFFFPFKNITLKIITLAIIGLYVVNIRLDSAVFLIVLFLIYYYFNSELSLHKKLLFFILSFILLLFFANFGFINVLDFDNSMSLAYQIDAYTENRLTNTSASSFVVKLQGTVLGFLILPFYTLITPFPPPIFFVSKFNFADFFESIFSVFFLMLMPRFLINLKNNFRSFDFSIVVSIIGSIVFLLILLSLTSIGAFRQKMYIYPFVFMFIFHNSHFFVYRYKELAAYFLVSFLLLVYILTRF